MNLKQRQSSPPEEADLEVTAELPVLDVAASGRFHADRCGPVPSILRLPRYWAVREHCPARVARPYGARPR